MKKIVKIVMCGILGLLCLGCGNTSQVYFEENTESIVQQTEHVFSTEETAKETQTADCYVYVCGAVKEPGVYSLPKGSRIYEAIEMAGGLKKSACAESINQAEAVVDGQMIKVLTYAEIEAQEVEAAEESDGKVNINQAGAEELMTLPGIGESKASSIISYRDENGPFTSIDELKNIAGIKEGVYSKIKDYITVN